MFGWRLVFGVVVGTAFLYFARPVILPIALAAVLGVALNLPVRWLAALHLPRALSAALVLLLLISACAFVFMQLVRPGIDWMNDAPRHIAELKHKVQTVFPVLTRVSQARQSLGNMSGAEEKKDGAKEKPPVTVQSPSTVPSTVIDWTGSLASGLIETVVLLYLLLYSGDLFLQKIVHVLPTFADKKRAVEISHEIQAYISNYLFAVSCINLTLGAVIGTGFWLLHLPNPFMWGMVAAILNYVPYFGPACGIALLAVVGILTYNTFWQGMLPPALYLGVHLLEADIITPMILGRRFTLNPVVIFIALMFWIWLWGIPGGILAVPLLACIRAICDHVPVLHPISELLSARASPAQEPNGTKETA